MPTYSFGFIQYSDISVDSGNPLTNSTVGATGSFTVNGGASPISISVDDDDNEFDDAYIDPGISQTLTSAVVVNGTTYSAGSVVELEFAVDTNTGDTFYYIRIDGDNVGIGGVNLPQPGQSYTITGSADGQEQLFTNLACFTRGTMIENETGACRVEQLRKGDLVRTLDDGCQPIRWIGQRTLSLAELMANPHLAPVRFETGSVGNDRPLFVSPQHRILLRGWNVELHFGEDSVLAPAKALVNGTTVTQVPPTQPVSYYHFLLDRHQIVFAAGCPSESFHPADQGVAGLSAASKSELFTLFPELETGYGTTARTVLKPGRAGLASLRLN